MHALGLVCVKAPGEGEALAAQLCAVGAVHAVQSSDGDSLTFGATRLWRSLHLSRAQLASCTLESVDVAHLRAFFGIAGTSDCEEMLIALSLLAGCDYAVEGATGVGSLGVVRALRLMLRPTADGGRTDVGLLATLKERLAAPEDAQMLASVACSGCAHCGHESGNASKSAYSSAHKLRGCLGCGTAKGCTPRAPGAPCGCFFHAHAEERHAERVLCRARKTAGFVATFETRVAAFTTGRTRARAAALETQRAHGGGVLTWQRRPDVERLLELTQSLGPGAGWSRDVVLRKVMPLLLLWDAQHPGAAGGPACCFSVARVLKPCDPGAKFGVPPGAAYAVDWAARPGLSAAASSDAAAGLALVAAKEATELRTLRASLLRAHAPRLLAACDAEQAAKAAAKAAAAARRAAREGKRLTEARLQPRINAVLHSAKPAASGSSSGAGSMGYRGAFGLAKDHSDEEEQEECAGERRQGASAPPPPDDGEGESLPLGWQERELGTGGAKRASPLKAASATPPKKPRPHAATAATGGGGTPVQRNIAHFFGRAAATPPTEPHHASQASLTATQRGTVIRKQLEYPEEGAPGEAGAECIDLVTPPPSQQKAPEDEGVIDLCSPDE